MVRAFERRPIDDDVLDAVLGAALRAPAAGNTDALDLLVVTDTERFWSLSFEDRSRFRFQGPFDAPVLVVPVVEVDAYVRRYAEADKVDRTDWPVPYWWVDGGAAVQNLLLAAVDAGLGALLFGLFERERVILDAFGVPGDRRALGAIALGHPAPDEPGRASGRPRRALGEVVHRDRW
jgi:nitroreductase